MENITWRQAVGMVVIWAFISLAMGYWLGQRQGQEIGFKDGYTEGYRVGIQEGIEANLATTFQEWLGTRATTQERTP